MFHQIAVFIVSVSWMHLEVFDYIFALLRLLLLRLPGDSALGHAEIRPWPSGLVVTFGQDGFNNDLLINRVFMVHGSRLMARGVGRAQVQGAWGE